MRVAGMRQVLRGLKQSAFKQQKSWESGTPKITFETA